VTVLGWVALGVIVVGLVFLWRRIAAVARGTVAWVRKRPPLGLLLLSVPLALLVLAGVVLTVWLLPVAQLADVRPDDLQRDLSSKEYFELLNAHRETILQALAGAALLLTLYFTWKRVTATEKQVAAAQQQVEVAREGQITERFTRAIEHLGSDKLEVRLGGIYALERIARDSEKDHWPTMEVLTAYVRERSPLPEEGPADVGPPRAVPVMPDIQAILTVIGRRHVEFDAPGQGLNLHGTNLCRAALSHAHLSRADLSHASMPGADLSESDLREANLFLADLSGATLSRANVSGAYLLRADLSGAKGLTREQIESAITDETTILPGYLREQKEETAEQGDEEAQGGE